tara:strand:+ start:453 stop:1337 length:885 start_codon:yes stop_codon:yes gene_type:complete
MAEWDDQASQWIAANALGLVDEAVPDAEGFFSGALNLLKDKDDNWDWGKILPMLAMGGGGIAGLLGGDGGANQPQGYQGQVDMGMTYDRNQLNPYMPANGAAYDPNRRPGSAGQTFFTNNPLLNNAGTGYAPGPTNTGGTDNNTDGTTNTDTDNLPIDTGDFMRGGMIGYMNGGRIPQYRQGGMIGYMNGGRIPRYQQGGIASMAPKGMYLGGPTDGMADRIPANIEGQQKAALSHGEFVVPADVVSHLGNGNSQAGAQQLYATMDKIRKARTGTTQQGRQINPNDFLPTKRTA